MSENGFMHDFSRVKVSDFPSGDREAKTSLTLAPEKPGSKLFSDFKKKILKITCELALAHKTSRLLYLQRRWLEVQRRNRFFIGRKMPGQRAFFLAGRVAS